MTFRSYGSKSGLIIMPADSLTRGPGAKVLLDYSKNRDLLDMIALLPDSVFSKREWKTEDRKKWYNEIKENNFYTDHIPTSFNQIYFKPNSAKFSVIDGYWTVSLYRTSANSFILLTDVLLEKVHDICIYEVKDHEIQRAADMKTVFGDYLALIKRADSKKDCSKEYEELYSPIFSFNFSDKTKAEIKSSWYLLKEIYADCLKGNTLFYEFNPDTKIFDLKKIYWTPKITE
jgi:hypothetical protein